MTTHVILLAILTMLYFIVKRIEKLEDNMNTLKAKGCTKHHKTENHHKNEKEMSHD